MRFTTNILTFALLLSTSSLAVPAFADVPNSNSPIQEQLDYAAKSDDYVLWLKSKGISVDDKTKNTDDEHIQFRTRQGQLAGTPAQPTPISTPVVVVNTTQPSVQINSGTRPDTYEKIINGIRLIKLIFD
jgi:hypothetical protein